MFACFPCSEPRYPLARPREFDETTVLDAALQCFWGPGYEATSIRDLTEAMGISTPSIYNAFGDKRQLYVEALEHYCRTRTHPLIDRIEDRHAGLGAIVAFYREIIERSVADRERRGCFLINSALEVAPHDKMMAKVVAAHLDAVHGFLRRQLQAAHAAGEVVLPAEASGTADHLLSVLLGLRVLARSRPERELLERTVGSALLAIGIPAEKLGPLRGSLKTRPRSRDG
jgi:TetR/AcrR family transcriptional repressor of nem operon